MHRRPKAALSLFGVAIVASMGITSCKAVRLPPGDTPNETPPTDSELTPMPVPVSRVVFRIPSESEIKDTVVLASVRRGRAIARNTKDSLPQIVGAALACVSCHPNDGTLRYAMPWVGVYARFPQYRSRAGSTQIIEDRINDCFLRSMNGKALDRASRDMRDLVAYMAFLSNGYPVGAQVDGQSTPALKRLTGDTTRARRTFADRCARCHGPNGLGTNLAPPLWGPRSFNIGAGMGRVSTAAAFIKQVMPQDSAGVLTPQDAYDLAALITSRPRPDYAPKINDWPHGDPLPDVPYKTRAAELKAKTKTAAAPTPRKPAASQKAKRGRSR